MRSIYPLIFVIVLATGCASPANTFRAGVEGGISSKPVSVQNAFLNSIGLTAGDGPQIPITPGQVPLVEFGKGNLLAIPVKVNDAKAHKISVKSYVVRKEDGSSVVFYPLVSLVDSKFNIYRTMKPKYEYAFSHNVLTNDFDIPAGVERLLIHTDAEFYHGSFVGSAKAGTTPSKGAYAAAGVLGGALGTMLVMSFESGKSIDFRFGEVGVVSVVAD